MWVPGREPIQRRAQGERVGAVGLDTLMFLVPVAWADDVMGHVHGGELPVQTVTKRSGLVTANDLPTRVDLLLHPPQRIRQGETLGWLRATTVVLNGHQFHHRAVHDVNRLLETKRHAPGLTCQNSCSAISAGRSRLAWESPLHHECSSAVPSPVAERLTSHCKTLD
jgi:hypothetical protein